MQRLAPRHHLVDGAPEFNELLISTATPPMPIKSANINGR